MPQTSSTRTPGRLHSNPLRILDTKNPAMQALVEAAPKLPDFLGEQSRWPTSTPCARCSTRRPAYRLNPRLVRGMDYYNLTVFEWVTDKLGAQGTVCGGGRYDGLIEQLGGKPAPASASAWAWSACCCCSKQIGRHARCPPAAPMVYAVVPGPAVLPQALVARGPARSRRDGADARRQGRLGQHEVAVQEGRRQRCTARPDLR
jgi:histidyl-tRNA synthetase